MADRTVGAAFTEVAEQSPRAVAVQDAIGSLAYAELATRATRLGARLAALPPSDEPVLVLSGAGRGVITAMLAAAQAGRRYLVLDARSPVAYRRAIPSPHGGAALVADPAGVAAAAELAEGRPVLLVDEAVDVARASVVVAPTDALSVSHTSGSSGRPKAVLHSHRAIVHNALSYADAVDVTAADSFLIALPFSGVAAATPTYAALLSGATACPFPLVDGGLGHVVDFAEHADVTIVHLPSSALVALAGASRRSLDGVRLVSLGGDRLLPEQVAAARAVFPRATLLHRYSTSETNWISGFRIEPDDDIPGGAAPLGTPVPWVSVAIADAAGVPVGPGQPGELVVSSDYLALGYLDDEELTARSFVPTASGRGYRTGDIVRMSAGGLLQFVGRADDIVKVRGVRVDLTAVEDALRSLPSVRDAAVVATGGMASGTSIAAFVVGDSLRPWQVRGHLAGHLPSAMLPARIEVLAVLPRNDRGKVDRAALLQRAARHDRPPHGRPANDTEATIAEAFSIVLALPDVGRDDDLLSLGADSLAVEAVCAHLEERLARPVDAAMLIESPTPALLAARLRDASTPARGRREDGHLVHVAHGAPGGLPVVMFSGGGGGHVEGMAQLARALDDRDAYVVMPRAFEYRGRPDRTVDAMAASAVRDIASRLGRGPVAVVGHSSGGTVALETARQLVGSGVQVPVVVLLDTLAMTEEVNRQRRFRPHLRQWLLDAERIRRDRGRGTSGLRRAYWIVRFTGFRAERRWLALSAGTVPRDGARQHRAFEALAKVANRQWVDGPYAGAVHLIRAGDPVGDPRSDVSDLKWSQVDGVRVTYSSVTATHVGMTSGAGAAQTAADVERVLGSVSSLEQAAPDQRS